MSARTAASSGESESMAEPWDIKSASSVLLWSVAVLPVGCCWSDVSAAAESDTKPKAKKPAEIIRISRRTWPPSQVRTCVGAIVTGPCTKYISLTKYFSKSLRECYGQVTTSSALGEKTGRRVAPHVGWRGRFVKRPYRL